MTTDGGIDVDERLMDAFGDGAPQPVHLRIYHVGRELRQSAWTYPEPEMIGKVPRIVRDGRNRLLRHVPYHILLLVTKGTVEFAFDEGAVTAEENQLVFLRAGLCHRMTALTWPMGYTWIHFRSYSPAASSAEGPGGWAEAVPALPLALAPKDTAPFRKLFSDIAEEALHERPEWHLISSGMLQQLIGLIARAAREDEGVPDPTAPGTMEAAIDYLHRHYNEYVSVPDLSRLCNLNPRYFIAKFKKSTGYTPVDYLQRLRIKMAKKLIRSGEYSISEAAYMVGFENMSYFTRLFRRIEGRLPSEYRKYRESAEERGQ